jgi:hypothetical protein
MTDLKRRKLLFKAKTQPANSSNGHEVDERHNIEVDGQMLSGEAQLLIWSENTYKQKKNQNRRNRVGARSRKRK